MPATQRSSRPDRVAAAAVRPRPASGARAERARSQPVASRAPAMSAVGPSRTAPSWPRVRWAPRKGRLGIGDRVDARPDEVRRALGAGAGRRRGRGRCAARPGRRPRPRADPLHAPAQRPARPGGVVPASARHRARAVPSTDRHAPRTRWPPSRPGRARSSANDCGDAPEVDGPGGGRVERARCPRACGSTSAISPRAEPAQALDPVGARRAARARPAAAARPRAWRRSASRARSRGSRAQSQYDVEVAGHPRRRAAPSAIRARSRCPRGSRRSTGPSGGRRSPARARARRLAAPSWRRAQLAGGREADDPGADHDDVALDRADRFGLPA